MTRYISNYTIAAGSPRVLINHVTTIDDDGRLVCIKPFDAEQRATLYVDRPVAVVPAGFNAAALPHDLRDAARLLAALPSPTGKPVDIVKL